MSTTQFFKREQKPIHGLNEEQLREAFDIYEKKVAEKIFEEVKSEYGVELEEGEIKDFIKVFISKGMTKGMELVADTSLVTDYYKHVKNIVTDNRCGVIDISDNSFYPCRIGEHWSTISKILEEKYKDLYEPFIELMHIHKGMNEYNGITRDYLDKFIISNFKFVAELNNLNSYLDNAKTEW
ncbi:hypothetical protein PP175_25475 (plasmid) [Aneurinibacillus sp. Ricciae_BoGa-3]|uniref:hypothetical protein n=1 Tax=Aneurinibacillus sp. Ricciae_BoGa-3 TaxID=3022697 RepID=UPI0023405870|nr:hypothetical protein [Aneurinibacillus sp. Ricciae_BoGa-3]WCK57421.1 hypothetical protein PP175_25475 [Aneurinibacillus sp. Ricciae_BoGa-3]